VLPLSFGMEVKLTFLSPHIVSVRRFLKDNAGPRPWPRSVTYGKIWKLVGALGAIPCCPACKGCGYV